MTNSTALVNSGLSFSIGANETKYFEGLILGHPSNDNNCACGFSGPNGAVCDIVLMRINGNPATARITSFDTADEQNEFPNIRIEAGNDVCYLVKGKVTNGGNAGAINLQIRSTDGNDVGLSATSFLNQVTV